MRPWRVNDASLAAGALWHQSYHRGFSNVNGLGILVQPDAGANDRSRLDVYGSLLSGHREIGILLKGVNAGIRGSIIRDTLLSEDGGVVGRGIASTCDSLTQGEGFVSGAHTSVLHIRECQVTDVTIAGVLYSEQDGSIAGSHISGAEFSVVMKVGSRVAITTDNQLSGSLQSKPSWQSMDPSPAPPPNLPFGQM